ncbi:MAG: phosphopantothenoylcysteine decarboxylase [archaeon]
MNNKLEVMITSGGTISRIDDVRHVGNFSSGTTGAYLAEAFLKAGHSVHFVYSKSSRRPYRERLKLDPEKPFSQEMARLSSVANEYLDDSPRLQEYRITTFDDYYNTVKRVLCGMKVDVAVLAAAVSDYSAVPVQGKISSDLEKMRIELVKNPKVISLVKEWNPKVYQVGFKLLSNVSREELIETAYQHGLKSGSDLTVANTIVGGTGGFARKDLLFVTPEKEVISVNERQLARRLVEEVENRVLKSIDLTAGYCS